MPLVQPIAAVGADRDDRVAELQEKLLSDEARRMYEESQSPEVNKALVTGLT
jgi:hypothetical protein